MNTPLSEEVLRAYLTERDGVIASESSAALMSLAHLKAEDRYWQRVYGNVDSESGLDLDGLKEWNKHLEEAVVGNPHIGRGHRLQASYVLKDGIHYRSVPRSDRGRWKKTQALIDNAVNQENYFSPPARVRRHRSLYTAGIALYLGDNETKTLTPLPLSRVVGDYRNPTGIDDRVWAYLLEWTETDVRTGEAKAVKRWVFTDRFPGYPKHMRPSHSSADWKPSYIKMGGTDEAIPVDKNLTILDQHANSVNGFAYGSPYALAALVWARIVRDLYMDGVTMTHALATFAFKASKGTQSGAEKAQLALATAQTPGSTAVVGSVQDLVPMSSAGKGYDFDSFRATVAIVATALDVSVIHLTADPGTAGSSYGSAQTLDLPTRLVMEARRQEDLAFERRVLKWMGAPSTAEPYFIPFTDSTEMLREMQRVILKWNTGLYEALEMKREIEGIDDVQVPDGVLLPNNEKSLPRADIDSDMSGPRAGTTSAPGQGQATGAGRTGDSHDMRTDTVSK